MHWSSILLLRKDLISKLGVSVTSPSTLTIALSEPTRPPYGSEQFECVKTCPQDTQIIRETRSCLTIEEQTEVEGSLPVEGGETPQAPEDTIGELCGENMDISMWNVYGVDIKKVYYFNGFYTLGFFGAGTTVSRQFYGVQSYKSIIVRFTLHIMNVWQGQTIWVKVNGKKTFETPVSGNNTFRNVEVQADVENTDSEQAESPVIEIGSSLSDEQEEEGKANAGWSVSDVAIHMNRCSCKYFYNSDNGVCEYAGNSIFYFLLKYDFQGTFNWSLFQPSWLQHILRLLR